MSPDYSDNGKYNSEYKKIALYQTGVKIYTLTNNDIYSHQNLQNLGAKKGDIVLTTPGQKGAYTPKDHPHTKDKSKLIPISQHYNTQSILVAFLLIYAAYYICKR